MRFLTAAPTSSLPTASLARSSPIPRLHNRGPTKRYCRGSPGTGRPPWRATPRRLPAQKAQWLRQIFAAALTSPVLRGQGAALYGPRACDKNMMTAIQALYREELDHGRAIRLWLYVVAALVFAMVLVGGATRLTESGLSITEWQPVTGTLPPLNQVQWQTEFQQYQAIPQYRQLNDGMSLTEFKTIYWWEWAH